VFKLEKAFSTLAKRVPTFHCQSGSKIPKIAQVGVTSWTSNGTGKAETHLSLTFTSCVKTFSGASGGQRENKNGFAHSANNCHDLYSQRKNGEQEWISAFPEGKNARKKPSLATTRSPRENPRKFPSCREKERKRNEA
jgi:hypothetical protein